MTFGARLHAAVLERGPLCAGLDPHPSLIAQWGYQDTVDGLRSFALTAAEALAPQVSVIKPQSAFYERFGSAGIAVLEDVIALSRRAGALVLLDVKRGDIGSTSEAYAQAYLNPASPLAVDAVTVSPYLGFGSLTPFVDAARVHDAGLFVLALTSNPEGPEVQTAMTPSGTVASVMLGHLRALNQGASPLGSFGAVVAANLGETGEDFEFNGPILAPGYGAQGGTVSGLAEVFRDVRSIVLPSSSRDLLSVGVAGLADAAVRANAELRDVITTARHRSQL